MKSAFTLRANYMHSVWMRADSRLMLSIKVSVRLLSSYQNDVGISKSVSWGAMLRSFAPGEKQEQQKTRDDMNASSKRQATSAVKSCHTGVASKNWNCQGENLPFWSVGFVVKKNGPARWESKTNGWSHLFSSSSGRSLSVCLGSTLPDAGRCWVTDFQQQQQQQQQLDVAISNCEAHLTGGGLLLELHPTTVTHTTSTHGGFSNHQT